MVGKDITENKGKKKERMNERKKNKGRKEGRRKERKKERRYSRGTEKYGGIWVVHDTHITEM